METDCVCCDWKASGGPSCILVPDALLRRSSALISQCELRILKRASVLEHPLKSLMERTATSSANRGCARNQGCATHPVIRLGDVLRTFCEFAALRKHPKDTLSRLLAILPGQRQREFHYRLCDSSVGRLTLGENPTSPRACLKGPPDQRRTEKICHHLHHLGSFRQFCGIGVAR